MALSGSAWARARERFIQDLEEPERLMFAEASLENIFYSANATQKAHQVGSRSRLLAAKLDALLAGINQYGKAMDVLSQASPFLCPLWGALRVVIHLSSQFQKYFAALLDMFEQIGDVIPRFQAYETLFSSSPRLMQALSSAYLNVAEFCTTAKAAFQNARKSVVNAKILFKVSWKSVEQQFGTLMKDFRRHRKSVEKEAELAHLLEAEKARAVERANIKRQDKQKAEIERIRVLSLLSSIQWKQQHHRILDMKFPGTGTWILNKEIFEQWKTATGTHQCLWCYGIPGSGKTILTASVIDHLYRDVDSPHSAVAHFYCDYADQLTLDISVILGTIIQQLLIGRPSIEQVVATKIREAYGDGVQKASSVDLINILQLIILDDTRCVYIILDGVDEASPDTQEKLFSSLAKLSTSCSTLLKLYISSREITLIPHHFPSCLSFDISESRVSEDIEDYIKASVQQRLHGLPVMASHPYLEESVVHELSAKAKGLFLWVSLQIEELCDPSHSERSFVSALQDLPEGLTATYERIYQKIARHSLRQKALAEKIFDWTICAKRPLRFNELKDAVAVDVDDTSWDRNKISAETNGKRFLCVCGNLAVFHERDKTVRLAHHTVEKFLVELKRNPSQTDAKISAICLTYLGFSDFETQMIPVREKQNIYRAKSSRQASLHLIPAVLGVSNVVFDFVLRLYDRNSKSSLPDVNYAELIRRYRKEPLPESLAQKYYLLDYVTANWIWHAKSFDPKIPGLWSSFSEFVFSKTLPFDVKPWGTLEGPFNLPHIAMYLWAMKNNHLPLLLLLKNLPKPSSLKAYLEYKTLYDDGVPPHLLTGSVRAQQLDIDFRKNPDVYDWPVMSVLFQGTAEMREFCLQEDPSIVSYPHILSRALGDANVDLIRSLLRGGAHFHKADIDASNALHNASRRGDKDFAKMLLEMGADINLRLFQDERGRTPLYEAVMYGFSGPDGRRERHMNHEGSCSPLDMIQLLLDSGADPNAKQIGEETALHKAISLGEAYVRLLLSRGADLNARNDQKRSILDVAVDDSDRMIKLLVEYNVDLEAKDSDGQTALLKAAQELSQTAVSIMTLIEFGTDVHAKDLEGRTVLHHLSSSTDGALLRILKLGVNVNAKDESSATPLDFAGREGDYAKYKLLLEFGAVHGEGNAPPLPEAAALGNIEMVKLLLRTGTDPNLLGRSGLSPLSSAVKAVENNKKLATALLKAGADPNLMDTSRVTPLSRAMMRRDKEMAKILIEAGAVIQRRDDIPYSPIYMAIGSGDVSMVEFLIEQGVDVSSFRPSDLSGLRAKHVRMCDYLTQLGVPFTVLSNDFNDEYKYDDETLNIAWHQ